MTNNIIDFININISYIAIVICLIAIWMIYNEKTNKNTEYLTIDNISSENFSEMVKQGKKLNFKCNIDGINYYLAQLPISECSNKLDFDCFTSTIVLIPEDVINSKLSSYFKTVQSNIDICNATYKIKCLNNLPLNAKQTEVDKCSTKFAKCNVDRFFIHDFNVTYVTGDTDVKKRKYLFKGTSTPNFDNSTTPTMLNQHLMYNKAIPTLCGDTFAYNGSTEKEHAEVIVAERVMDSGSIIGSNSEIKVKLLFNTQKVVVGKDKKGLPVYMPWPANNPTKEYTYVGICKDTKNINYICKSGNFSYKRVCLLTQSEVATDDKRVLEFEPIIVN